MSWGFSPQAREVMQRAHDEATTRGALEISAAHLLVAVAETGGSGRETLEALGVDPIELVAVCRGKAPSEDEPSKGPLPFDDHTRRAIFELSIEAMGTTGHRRVFSAHLVLAVFHAGGLGRELLQLVGIGGGALDQAVGDALALSAEVGEAT